ncbi:carbohydrate kinase family protein [Streptomyces sp. ISL-66]|uniref:carbohydrate kinase family protein n=1 Tax=Streptomyces sp. ISL-66 TaxID=2819186 RepID=UPI001BE992B6|nr:carbohydrate kinase family protein [Streptomyces sp. ISL-66]MBT2470350.1 carbohydrate kinase family protein [Streptomyces sp. ISL-66]
MRIAVTGSVATDHLMTFPGRISDQLLADKLDRISLSFLVDTLEIRDGGVAANIAYGLARLGHRPLLVAAVGRDFRDYGRRLAELGVRTSAVHASETRHTARFLCTTDPDGNQLASFYAGAMAEAADIDLVDVMNRCGRADLVLIGADAPAAMLRHTRACRALEIPYAADPAQQLARLEGPEIRELTDGAHLLFTNEYEHELLLRKTGWTHTEVLRRVGTWITTLGEKGSRIERAGSPAEDVSAVPTDAVVDPTGVGDAFRAGYLAALAAGHTSVRCAQTGSVMASLALSAVGTQTYDTTPEGVRELLRTAYGADAHPLGDHGGRPEGTPAGGGAHR